MDAERTVPVESAPPSDSVGAGDPHQERLRDRLLSIDLEITKEDREIERLSEKLKAAKSRRETLIFDLRAAIKDQQPELPFGATPNPTADDWRAVPLAKALNGHVTDKVLEKLAEAELTTVGQLADYTAKCRLTDIKGVGQAKAEAIELALEEFWAARRVMPGDLPTDQPPPQEGAVEEGPVEESEPALDCEPDGATLARIDGGD